MFALLLGVSESAIEAVDFNGEEKKCKNIAIEIEAAMYIYFK